MSGVVVVAVPTVATVVVMATVTAMPGVFAPGMAVVGGVINGRVFG